MRRLELTRPSELARALGMTGYDAPRTVRRWLQDINGPQYEYMMMMLEKAGWIGADAEAYLRAAEEEASQAELPARRLAAGAPPRGKQASG